MRRAPSLAALLCVTLLAAGRPALGHDEPGRVEIRRGGAYRLRIGIYDARPTVVRPLHVEVQPLPGSASLDGATITARGVPGPETNAVATRAIRLRPMPGGAPGVEGAVLFSVRGGWNLEIRVSGPSGTGVVRIPVAVTAPWVVPPWVGWALGLSPLLGLLWFGWWQRGYLRRLEADPTYPD